MCNHLKYIFFITLLLFTSQSFSSDHNCHSVTINDSNNKIHINIATNIEQCLDITNNTNEHIAIISNTLGANLNIIESSSNSETESIAGDSYFVIKNNHRTHLKVIAKSTAGDRLKISISTEKEAENIIFKNHAINFLLLGLIFSNITVNFLYSILKKSKASLHLSLLTSLTVIYFIFESIISQINIPLQTAEFLIKLLSLCSCAAGFFLLHAFIKAKKRLPLIISIFIIATFIVGLAPSVPLEIYRLFFIAVVLHVFINILIACNKNPYLWWYLVGSSIPSAISLSLILINELLPTIASYNLMLLAIFLQSILISKAIPKIKQEKTDTSQQPTISTNTDFKHEYLTFTQEILQSQIAGIMQLIKHCAQQLPPEVCDSSIANIQLAELYLSAHNHQNSLDPQQLASQLIQILQQNNISQSKLQQSSSISLLYTEADATIIHICQEIIAIINIQSATIIQCSVIDGGKLFLSHHHARERAYDTELNSHWLIVDDNQNLLSVMAAQCESISQKVLTAHKPAAAIDHLLNNTLHITHIMIDWNLEHETAYNTIKRINSLLQHHNLSPISIHIMTAQKIYSASFSEFPLVEVLEKPITIEKLKKIKATC